MKSTGRNYRAALLLQVPPGMAFLRLGVPPLLGPPRPAAAAPPLVAPRIQELQLVPCVTIPINLHLRTSMGSLQSVFSEHGQVFSIECRRSNENREVQIFVYFDFKMKN